eukprot:gene6084-12277_t
MRHPPQKPTVQQSAAGWLRTVSAQAIEIPHHSTTSAWRDWSWRCGHCQRSNCQCNGMGKPSTDYTTHITNSFRPFHLKGVMLYIPVDVSAAVCARNRCQPSFAVCSPGPERSSMAFHSRKGQTFSPSRSPTRVPTRVPSKVPTRTPSRVPTSPTSLPTKQPSRQPNTVRPSSPTVVPTTTKPYSAHFIVFSPCFICYNGTCPSPPTMSPTSAPTVRPTLSPSLSPIKSPTVIPTVRPTTAPTVVPISGPTPIPTRAPSVIPTKSPTVVPTMSPTVSPTVIPTLLPTVTPTFRPSVVPSSTPTVTPTVRPSTIPSTLPTVPPTTIPTPLPTVTPTFVPTVTPTVTPTFVPTVTPTVTPTFVPTVTPSSQPTTRKPTVVPSSRPTDIPITGTRAPSTAGPTVNPTVVPTLSPTVRPTVQPTNSPSVSPSLNPTLLPTSSPTVSPTVRPTVQPTNSPSVSPSLNPTSLPTSSPTVTPSRRPTTLPTQLPIVGTRSPTTAGPTVTPTVTPSRSPTVRPTTVPTVSPTVVPCPGDFQSGCRSGDTINFVNNIDLYNCRILCATYANPLDPVAECITIQYTPSNGVTSSSCELKSARNGALASCPNPATQTIDFNCITKSPTVSPTFEPTIQPSSVTCPGDVTTGCRVGATIKTTNDDLVNCRMACSIYADPNDATIRCVSIEYTPASGSSLPICTLKSGRDGSIGACSDPNTETFDFNCVTKEPTVSPTPEPTVQPTIVTCPGDKQPGCRVGDTISTFTALSLYECRRECSTYADSTDQNKICVTIEYIPFNGGIPSSCELKSARTGDLYTSSTGRCELKSGRTGDFQTCPYEGTVTYDYNCPTCPWFPDQKCRLGDTIEPVMSGVSLDDCRTGDFQTCPYEGTVTYDYNCPEKICLNVVYLDKFGDKPGNAKFFAYDNKDKYSSYTSTCEENPLYISYCFDPSISNDGDYVVFFVHGLRIPFANDILWQVYNPRTESIHTGNYKTTMKFVYHKDFVGGVFKSNIQLSTSDSEDIISNTIECESCLVNNGNGVCKNPPPLKPLPKVAPPKITDSQKNSFRMPYKAPVRIPVKSDTHVDSMSHNVSHINGSSISRHLLSYKDYDVDSKSKWFQLDRLGASYQITDVYGLKVYYAGTVCNDDITMPGPGGCHHCLAPGSYLYRVDGAFFEDKEKLQWEFCGRHGGASNELSFTIGRDGSCQPKVLINLKEVCKDDEKIVSFDEKCVILSGSFDLGGDLNDELSEADMGILHNAINEEFNNAATSSRTSQGVLELSDIKWSSVSDSPQQRLLGSSTKQARVSFKVKLSAYDYGANELGADALDTFGVSMKSYLSRSMSVGVFVAKLVRSARQTNSVGLQSVNFARFVEMKVIHEMNINKEVSYASSIVVTMGAVIGVLFGVLIYRGIVTKREGYTIVVSESTHDKVLEGRLQGEFVNAEYSL